MQISFLLSTVLAACLGCAARHLSSDPGVAGNGIEGRVAFELLADPNLTAPAVSAQQVLMAPAPLDEPLPEYPELALATEAAPVTLAVRIIIDETGMVREVLDSPLDERPMGDKGGMYRAAVEEAVRRWRYHPAIIRTLGDGEDLNHDGRIDHRATLDEKPVRSYLDLRFTFEVVSGRGRVVVAPSAGD
jgi:outer membrane biosynthesis protein TonB